MVPTWSPAMDILVPYNVERILTLASNFDFQIVDRIMKEFEVDPKVGTKIPEDLLQIIKKTIVGKVLFIIKYFISIPWISWNSLKLYILYKESNIYNLNIIENCYLMLKSSRKKASLILVLSNFVFKRSIITISWITFLILFEIGSFMKIIWYLQM